MSEILSFTAAFIAVQIFKIIMFKKDKDYSGYDDIAFASLLEVPLTTVRQPIDAIGQKATEVINQLVNSEENIDSKIIILEPKLIVRSSTKTIS